MDLIFEVIASLLGDVLVGLVTAVFDSRTPDSAKQPVRFFIFVVLGCCVGAASTRLWSSPLITTEAWRVVWLIISPTVAAAALFGFQAAFFPRAPRGIAMLHAAAFSFTVALWRFLAFS
ncbi:MAG: hypothetical protein ACO1OB_16005 [Archangium sp.]